MQHWLTLFILEVRKKDGSEFPPNSLYHLVCGIVRYVKNHGKPELDIFKDAKFANFRASLDSEMKRLQSLVVGSKHRQAEVLTEEDEELLWQQGLLGDSSPQSLLDTMIFMCGLYFALRSGQEHWQLRFQPCQIQLFEPFGTERSYLKYTDDISKNRPGGLKGRKTKPKTVKHHAYPETACCFVRLFKLYMQKCPSDRPHALTAVFPQNHWATTAWARLLLGYARRLASLDSSRITPCEPLLRQGSISQALTNSL